MCGVTLVGCSTLRSNTAAKSVWMLNCTVSTRQDVAVAAAIFFTFSHCDRRKFTSQTSDNMDRWKSTARKKLRERESQKREDQRGRKSEEGRSRCAKRKESRETQCLPIVRVSGGSKSRLANALGAEAAGQRRDENLHPLWREAHFQVYSVENCRVRTAFGRCDVETVRAVVARSTLPSQNVQSTQGSANR